MRDYDSDRPAQEPEILPPERGSPPRRDAAGFYAGFGEMRGVHVIRLGRGSALTLGLLIACLTALILLVLVGAVLIWIPVVALVIAVMLVSGLVRTVFGRR